MITVTTKESLHIYDITAHIEETKIIVTFTRSAASEEEARKNLLDLYPDFTIDEVKEIK